MEVEVSSSGKADAAALQSLLRELETRVEEQGQSVRIVPLVLPKKHPSVSSVSSPKNKNTGLLVVTRLFVSLLIGWLVSRVRRVRVRV